ncbi:MAG: beta-galactosidase [Clostridium sp.]|nr:beta-galactosidase [Clostridium sp.]
MKHELNLKNVKPKIVHLLNENFRGNSNSGEEISFTNYYMQKNGKPFFGVSGEFHFSRMNENRWEDELIKMKLGGINIVSTYVFWNHHEEEEGVFDFTGRRNVRRFIELCKKHDLYVILRVGPFDHGEVRNGGMPDWLYGKPFEVRNINDGFIYYAKRLYSKIAHEVQGLFFKDSGPIIGVQIDNEYMHSSAPWEITTGISDEWVFGGNEGDEYMLYMKKLAAECGLLPVFYTCTAWGGASTPKELLPLWGGYAFRPWIFYSHKGKHPSTEEYVYQDFHNNEVECTNDFKPKYKPEEYPYACCEMGGGMTCSYNYRFKLPYKSIDAMSNIKIASGCNFLGYYMYQGGSNPIGKHGTFMNEGQVPKISYDYQAALGEFGQVRESYRRMKNIHYFVKAYSEELCGLGTVLPDGASYIEPTNMEKLRYAVRTDGKRGFVFINNYQDHENMPDRIDEEIVLNLKDEDIRFNNISIAGDENCILPFNLDLDGIKLRKATAQPITVIERDGVKEYIFFTPKGMKSSFEFEDMVTINGEKVTEYECEENKELNVFTVEKDNKKIKIMCMSRDMADDMYIYDNNNLIFTKAALLADKDGIRIETADTINKIYTYPSDLLSMSKNIKRVSEEEKDNVLGCYEAAIPKKEIDIELKEAGSSRYTIDMPQNFMENIKDALLQIDYAGDIGHAFIDGVMINDNFCNNDTWEIGLKDFCDELSKHPLTIYITPLKEGVNVNVESAMAARMEHADSYIGKIDSVKVKPVYEINVL